LLISRPSKFMVAVGLLTFPFVTGFAQAPIMKPISEEVHYNQKHEYTGVTVHIGARSLTLQSDLQNSRLKAGEMPALIKQRDAEGRDVAVITESRTPVAAINVKSNGHPDTITLGNGLKYMVVAQGNGLYKESLFGAKGKVLNSRSISADPRRPAELVNLDPVARDLGLSSEWRQEIAVEANGSLLTVSDKAGKVLLYVLRNGPDSVGFDPAGTPLYYDVMATLFVGRAEVDKEYADLDTLVPDHFIYTRDGRIGAYVRNAAVAGIHSFWTERDASGANIVKFKGGVAPSHSGSAHSVRPSGASPDLPERPRDLQAAPSWRNLRPSPNATYYCETTQTCYSTDYGESGCWPAQTSCYCVDCTSGGVGTCGGLLPSILSTTALSNPRPECGGGGTGSSGSGSNQISGNATLYQAVNTGLTKASDKLTNNQQCTALLSSLTTTSPQPGGTSLLSIMNQRGWTNPTTYLNSGIGFYSGQTHLDSTGQSPCSYGSRYAWTEPFKTQVWVCDKYSQLAGTPGMAGDILIHELLHTLGLPEGGSSQYTNQQITDLVVSACGN
jgi:hypothetical protein